MKKKNLLITGLIVIASFSLLYLNSKMRISVPVRTYYTDYLTTFKGEVDSKLQALGITYDQFISKKNDYLKKQKKSIDRQCNVSESIENVVVSVLRDFNINPNHISILYWDNPSPAAALSDTNTIYINEAAFTQLPPLAQQFALAHEVQHMLYQDDIDEFIVGRILTNTPKLDENDYNNPVNLYSRFTEERADLLAALKNESYAQGYKEFSEYLLENDGDKPTVSHPKNSRRLQLAQTIVDAFNNEGKHTVALT